MDLAYRTPLLDCFRRGDVPRDVRLLAARGALAPRAQEQLALLVFLVSDPDPQIAAVASATLDALPRPALARFLRRSDIPDELRAFFAALGVAPEGPINQVMEDEQPLVEADEDELTIEEPADATADGAADGAADANEDKRAALLSSLTVPHRMRLALKGSREQRSLLIRDTNKIVAAAVLSSPKLSDSEVEAFARMTNVGEDVLRTIGTTRAWTRSYGVTASLVKNPKTPPAISLTLLPRMNDRDIKMLATDRNVAEVLRLTARKMISVADSRKR
jgi:hypothetical protein